MFRWFTRRPQTSVTPPAPRPVAVRTLVREIEILSLSPHKLKVAELIKWPNRTECFAAEGGSEPVIYVVHFLDADLETEIPVYIRYIERVPGKLAMFVEGTTGPRNSGFAVSVAYDLVEHTWSNQDPDQPRQIMYRD